MNSNLIDAAESLMSIQGEKWENLYLASKNYVETISLASLPEIEQMFLFCQEKYLLEFPYWARLIAGKLILLQTTSVEKTEWVKSILKLYGGPEQNSIIDNL